MYQKSLIAEAELFDSESKVFGGVCKFKNPETNEDWYMMIHPDSENKPMVSRVKGETITSSWSCWEWMNSWLEAYEQANPNDFSVAKFKAWLNTQPMTAS